MNERLSDFLHSERFKGYREENIKFFYVIAWFLYGEKTNWTDMPGANHPLRFDVERWAIGNNIYK